jgi:hypothetical protein
MEILTRPKDDHLLLRAMSAYVRDGGDEAPSMNESNIIELANKLFIELRCEKGSLLSLYKYNFKSGRLRKQ